MDYERVRNSAVQSEMPMAREWVEMKATPMEARLVTKKAGHRVFHLALVMDFQRLRSSDVEWDTPKVEPLSVLRWKKGFE
jgi:hypothetical protein